MATAPAFSGFDKKTVSFFRGLAKDNSKAYFEAHRGQYEQYVKGLAGDFVVAMGDKLKAIAPSITADPRVNKSLFRLNRDARFSHDKTPYKTHMGLWMWEGPHKRMENSGFYFHVEPARLMLGVGMYCFPKELLGPYRDAVAHPVHGQALADAVAILDRRGFALGGEHFKRVPRGYDPDHPNADLLRHNGLWAGVDMKIPDEFYTPKLIDFCFGHYKKLLPLHQWLVAFTERQL